MKSRAYARDPTTFSRLPTRYPVRPSGVRPRRARKGMGAHDTLHPAPVCAQKKPCAEQPPGHSESQFPPAGNATPGGFTVLTRDSNRMPPAPPARRDQVIAHGAHVLWHVPRCASASRDPPRAPRQPPAALTSVRSPEGRAKRDNLVKMSKPEGRHAAMMALGDDHYDSKSTCDPFFNWMPASPRDISTRIWGW
jgi:hypothetical protein